MSTLSKSLEELLESAKTEVVPIIIEQASDLLEGATEDIHRYAAAIAEDSARAVLISDDLRREAVLKENLAQLQALAELHHVKLRNSARETFRRVASGIVQTFVRVAIAAV